MKKFSLIAGLAALATVGGVFAAWHFEGGDGVRPGEQSIGVGVDATITVGGVPGNLTLENTLSGLKFTQDAVNNCAKLTADSGQLTLTYTEHATAKDITLGGNTYTLKATVTYEDESNMTSYFTKPSSTTLTIGTIQSGSLSLTLDANKLNEFFTFEEDSITTAAQAKSFIDTFADAGEEKVKISFSLE